MFSIDFPIALILVPIQRSVPNTSPESALVFVLVIGLAAVHLSAGRLRVLACIPRSRWLSFGSGISVAYIFIHLLPELQAGAEIIERSDLLLSVFFERHVYLVALTGFTVFYGLERLVTRSQRDGELLIDTLPEAGVFWIHIGSFVVYNAIIGYLLHDRGSAIAAVLFAVAMGLHFVVNDYSLREDHEERYHSTGRWLLSVAVVVGAIIGAIVDVGAAVITVLVAFLAGGVILNVIKEELPDEVESQWWAFTVGAISYTAILLLL